jgi:hypothetical protein
MKLKMQIRVSGTQVTRFQTGWHCSIRRSGIVGGYH